jgi:hypothetical protein
MSRQNVYNFEADEMGTFITRADFARLSPAAQAEIRRLFAPPPPPQPAICLVHPPPAAPGMPAALGYSANSRGEYSTFCSGCSCPPDVRAARATGEGGGAAAAGGGEESPAAGASLAPAHNTSAWERMRAMEAELEEAIAASRVTELAAFEAIVERCADYLEPSNPVLARACDRLGQLRVFDAGLRGADYDAWVAAGAPEGGEGPERDDDCRCRGRYCSDCWPGGYESDGRGGR